MQYVQNDATFIIIGYSYNYVPDVFPCFTTIPNKFDKNIKPKLTANNFKKLFEITYNLSNYYCSY